MKKILFLGASPFQLLPIDYALLAGHCVITCDNKPNNPGHKLAHKSFNVSTTDKAGILRVALDEKIDGIMTYASEVSAPTAAYVAEKLNLPTNSYETVQTLTHKGLFREFLLKNGLQKQNYRVFKQADLGEAVKYAKSSALPLVIKPVCAGGSKGVSKLFCADDAEKYIHYAFQESFLKEIIIEDYIPKAGRQICGEGFMADGKLQFVEFGDGHYYDDETFNAPFAETFPSAHAPDILEKAKLKIEKVLKRAGYLRGVFNLEVIIKKDGDPFIIELGPRGGGNNLGKAVFLATNISIAKAAVESCLSRKFCLNPRSMVRSKRFYACYIVHSKKEGFLDEVVFEKGIEDNIVERHMYCASGDAVKPFQKGSAAIGSLILSFASFEEMLDKVTNMNRYMSVKLKHPAAVYKKAMHGTVV